MYIFERTRRDGSMTEVPCPTPFWLLFGMKTGTSDVNQRLAPSLQQYFSVESPVQPAYGTHYASLHRSSNIK
ncbi:hypothetical protein ACFX2H_033375 [Malus domestica]